jgi:precorrin-3B synthase
MNAPLRRGACPTLAAPIETGDGLLARLNPVASGLSPDTLAALCEAALRHGNGLVEITARGSFQIRGLTPASAAMLAQEVGALGIAVRGGVPVETAPLAGLDPHEVADSRPLAQQIRAGIAAAGLEGRLGPKVSVVVDGGGPSTMDELAADVRLTARRDRDAALWRLAIAGNAATAVPVADLPEAAACEAAVAMLGAVAALGPAGRARDLPAAVVAKLVAGIAEQRFFALEREPCRSRADTVRNASTTAGRGSPFDILPLRDGRFAVTAALPFGQVDAGYLIGFLERATAAGAAEIRLAPRHALILLCPSAAPAEAVRATAGNTGLIVDAGDPRGRIAACPGAPACASGHIAARAIAAELAAALPQGFDIDLHVSGCAKRCARPGHDGLTLLGLPGRAGLVLESAGREPVASIARKNAAAAFARVAALVASRRRAGESEGACLARLGGHRLAEAFAGTHGEAHPAAQFSEGCR